MKSRIKCKTKKQRTQYYLKECFDYSRDTGVLTWRKRPREHFRTEHGCNIFNSRYAGSSAGCVNVDGYLLVGISGELFYGHRIIYKWIHGEEPPQVDHINHIRHDNRPDNLRAVTSQINMRNQKLGSANTSGVIGVYWHKNTRKWNPKIMAGGKLIHLGLFDDIEDAASARKEAEVKYGYHENHGRTTNQTN